MRSQPASTLPFQRGAGPRPAEPTLVSAPVPQRRFHFFTWAPPTSPPQNSFHTDIHVRLARCVADSQHDRNVSMDARRDLHIHLHHTGHNARSASRIGDLRRRRTYRPGDSLRSSLRKIAQFRLTRFLKADAFSQNRANDTKRGLLFGRWRGIPN